MQAVEFKTIIQEGTIKMPNATELPAGAQVKVIVMWERAEDEVNIEEPIIINATEMEEDNSSFSPGNARPNEKPSDFAGIWKNRKKVDAKKLRQRAWARRK